MCRSGWDGFNICIGRRCEEGWVTEVTEGSCGRVPLCTDEAVQEVKKGLPKEQTVVIAVPLPSDRNKVFVDLYSTCCFSTGSCCFGALRR